LPRGQNASADWLWRAPARRLRDHHLHAGKQRVVILRLPRSPGFSSTSTRRSASLAVISLPLSHVVADRIEFPQCGRQALFGSGVINSPITFHNAEKISPSIFL